MRKDEEGLWPILSQKSTNCVWFVPTNMDELLVVNIEVEKILE
jgi:hypothetical protein